MARLLPTGYLSVTTMKFQGEAITRRLSKTMLDKRMGVFEFNQQPDSGALWLN